MTLNGVMAVILRYFSEFGSLPGALRKSSRSLSHLLTSSCQSCARLFQQQTKAIIRRRRRCVFIPRGGARYPTHKKSFLHYLCRFRRNMPHCAVPCRI